MEIETKIISIETIKPSSPTPKSLQKYHLSFIDQGTPPFFTPLVYFYSSNPEIPISQKSDYLKKSLSVSLSTYYPLAGRLVGNLYVDCNDAGIPFSIIEANYYLSQVISNPNPDNLTEYLPYNTCKSQNPLLAVQATYFRCGGVALGLLVSHKIADAFSKIMFVNTWSAVARNDDFRGLPLPKFDGAVYFPPQDIPEIDLEKEVIQEELASRNFTFTASQISFLRKKYSGGSRVEALLAHIRTHFLAATDLKSDLNKMNGFTQMVNLRTLVDDLPPSEYHFGNFLGASITMVAAGDDGAEFLQKIHEAKKSNYDRFMDVLKGAREKRVSWREEFISQHVISLQFTSLCGFPLYEADFGWGKPVWIGIPGFPIKNLVMLKSTESGGGIEVNIRLSKQDMEKFEVNFERQQLKSKL